MHIKYWKALKTISCTDYSGFYLVQKYERHPSIMRTNIFF